MQPPRILHEGAFPGYWQGKEQSIEPGVFEYFSDVSSGRENKPFLVHRNRGELRFYLPPFFRRPSSPQNDDMPDKAVQSVVQFFQVLFAFRQQDEGAAFLHGHEYIIDNLIVTFLIVDQQSVEFLDGCVRGLYGSFEVGLSDYESMIERALCQLATRIGFNRMGPSCMWIIRR